MAMSKREKIIVSVMAATVMMAGYLYLGPGTTVSRINGETLSDASADDFAQKVIQQFREDTTLDSELFTLRSAESEWGEDPFLEAGARLSDTARQAVKDNPPDGVAGPPSLVRLARLRRHLTLAIINNMEYTSGDAIDVQGHYVRRIQPHQVEIGKLKAPDTIILKLTELDPGMGKY